MKTTITISILVGISLILTVFRLYTSNSNKPNPTPNTSNIQSTPTRTPLSTTTSTPYPSNSPHEAKTTVVAKELNIPWSMDFLPNGDLVFSERRGSIKLISFSTDRLVTEIDRIPVKAEGEGGLLGLTLHPKFSQNSIIYLYYTYSLDKQTTLNKVSRFTYSTSGLKNETVIIDKIPGNINHNGGRIKFGPDGYLYITTGDSLNPSLAQSKTSLAGKILRVTDNGKPAPGNPFRTAVYSLGHRNPQGLAWDNQKNLWSTEHGRSGDKSGLDELNLIKAGKNYGWNLIEGDATASGMITPTLNSGDTVTWAPAGMAYLNGSLFFAGLRGNTLYEAILSGTKVVKLKTHLVKQFGRIRDVVLGPDNMLYLTTSNRDGRGSSEKDDDRIIKIDPESL